MSKLKMNCSYCGRKCSLEKDFCIPQDSVYVCKSCYEWQRKLSDLETKLVEKERLVNDFAYEIAFLDNRLAEKDLRIEELESQFGYECECNAQFVDCQKENERLKQQLAEKEKAFNWLHEKYAKYVTNVEKGE